MLGFDVSTYTAQAEAEHAAAKLDTGGIFGDDLMKLHLPDPVGRTLTHAPCHARFRWPAARSIAAVASRAKRQGVKGG